MLKLPNVSLAHYWASAIGHALRAMAMSQRAVRLDLKLSQPNFL